MDLQNTISRAKQEYKAYLQEQHPQWTEDVLSKHVTDAFYLYQKSIVVAFWKCFVSNEALQEAKQELYEYFRVELGQVNAQDSASNHVTALEQFKQFLDAKGGVQKYVGPEYDGEATIYQYAKMVYEGEIAPEVAVADLCKAVPGFGASYHKMIISIFAAMMTGKGYLRRCNVELTVYFVKHIAQDYGQDRLHNALQAVYANIRYNFEKSGTKSTCFRRACMQIAKENGITMDFGEAMFDGIIPQESSDPTLTPDEASVNYWLYAPGDHAINWEVDYKDGIMAIGWAGLGDLMQYSSKEEMRTQMQAITGSNHSYRNQALASWQFANEIKIGDIVFVKGGLRTLLGKGVVTGEYQYDPARGEFCHIRTVRWTDKGQWDFPKQLAVKTLTNMTPYTEYLKLMQEAINSAHTETVIQEEQDEQEERQYEPYTTEDFLHEVFMDEARYNKLKTLLLAKKNVILQGAPGVGKTFVAKRLAYALMGERDNSRVKMVQFHQSYSYEDFIMGYRPTASGFELKKGVFYEFCKQAAEDDRPYFFIIDEINRGNLSKIFGELFMLIENDKRGGQLQLLYADEQFAIPSNVYLIGMMNTADRSLAMLDYALRRRFAFFEMTPAFASAGFKAYRAKVDKRKFDRLIETVEALNEEIAADDSLGAGFCIGHSFFCTNATVSDAWLQSVVEFELIPLLKEYWFDEGAKAKEWGDKLVEAVK